MASNKDNMIKKHGSETAYKQHMGSISKGRAKRKPDTIESLTRRIQVVAEGEGLSVQVKVRRI